LSAARVAFLIEFLPAFQAHYSQLAEGREQVMLEYKSQLPGQNFRHLLLANERRDQVLQRSTVGPHRDDFSFLMDGQPIKSYGSQGQQKSFVIALKLAQFELLAARKSPAVAAPSKPLLLLDDIFDRLDDKRIARLLQLVAAQTFGQVFLTDTNLARTDAALAGVSSDIRRFHIERGAASLITD
ncbi:MAG: DNA replication and repair protein RecF, partial [Hymenobacter sp.]